MATDPFSNIKNLSVEIGQPTYVELISIQERREIAVLGPEPNVEIALNLLAFGRKPRYIPPVRKQGVFTPTRRVGIPQKYNLTGPQKSAEDFKSERIVSEFRSLLVNPFVLTSCAQGPVVCSEPPTDCMIDFGVSLDDTGSMSGAINAVKAAVDTIAGYFQTISGGNYRMGLVTFKDCPPVSRLKFPTGRACGNIEAFRAALAPVIASGGDGGPEAGDISLQWCVDGQGFGPWRDDPNVVKVILHITDNSVAGCNDIYDPADKQHLLDVANAAAACGIKFICAAVGNHHPSVMPDLTEAANITGGIFVNLPPNGRGLAELIYSYVFSLCGAISPPPECLGGDDVILNGEFNTDIAGWTEYQPTILWNSTKQALELLVGPGDSRGTARQTVSGLTPGDFVTMFFDVIGGTVDSVLTYGFEDGPVGTYAADANSEAVRLSLNMNVPDDGIVTISFESTSNTLIDNVKLCVVPVTDCGPGTRNSILNPHFSDGVEFWTDVVGTPLTPPNDPRWWDSGNDVLIISIAGAREARQSVSGLTVGRSMTFGFTLLNHEPDTIAELELVYGILDGSGNIIFQQTIINGNVPEFPYIVFQPFTVPTETVTVFFRTGALSGAARIRDVLLCDLTGICQPGYTRLSFDPFDENIGEWAGGLWQDGHVFIPSGPGMTRTYPGLETASIFQITLEVLDNRGVVIELASGSAVDQFTSPLAPGLYTHSCIVQNTGLVHVTIRSLGVSVGDIINGTTVDNILVCLSEPPGCDGSITQLTTNIEWKGIPRRPVNIFNMFARITLRNPSDPFDRTIVNIIPTADGHLGTHSTPTCDFWKQQGNGGSAELSITDTNLTPSNIASVNPGNFASVATRDNWLWSIPASQSGLIQDALITTFPPESVGNVVESVEIFYLANQITPIGTTPTGLLYMANSSDQTIELLHPDGDIDIIRSTDVGNIDDLEIDETFGKIFYIQIADGAVENSLWSCNLDGSNGVRLFYTDKPTGIDLDRTNQHIYYALYNTSQIRRCNYDGSNDQLIIASPKPPLSVTLDLANGYLYWAANTSSIDGDIYRCNLDGSGLVLIASTPNVRCVAIQPTKLYVGSASGDCIFRMNLDGSNFESLGISDVSTVDDLAIKNGVLYIADTGQDKIISTDLDGGNREELTSDIRNRRGIALAGSGSVGGGSPPVNPGPFICAPDPADEFDIVIKYRNSLGVNRAFRTTVLRNSLYPQEVSFSGTPWDTISALGNGLRGTSARWESAKFELDNTDGTGLDQCTDPIDFIATGTGNLIFGEFGISGVASFFDPCDAEVIVEEITKGVQDNEVQSIVLPNPSGGTWDLSVTIRGDTQVATIPWNAGADVVQIRIGRLSNVGHGNVTITGTGTFSDPYMVEFVGDLGGIDIPLMTADGSGLTGTSPAVVETITNGTKNERQTISVAPGTLHDLIVEFNGATSIPIVYNWSLNQKQGALWGISTIGNANVLVTGGTSDRDIPYTGDLIIDFVGAFNNANVPEMIVQPTPHYSIATNWNGGTGVNEKQRIRVIAASGTFIIKFYSPDDPSGATFFNTAPIPYNASADDIKTALIASGFVTNTDLVVTKTPDDPTQPLLNEWTIEFVGARSGIGIRQMEVDAAQLRGGTIDITGITDGGSAFEKQRITITKANGGFFRLTVNVNDVSELSGRIIWNTTAAGMQQVLERHSEINPGDIVVVQNANGPDPDVIARFTVTFKRFGDVPLMIPDFERSLLCNPIILAPVPPPPYPYPIEQECEIEDLSCQSGPLLSRPCPGDEPLSDELCCDELTIRESANISVGFVIQRDLFDPNKKTSPRNGVPNKMTIKDITRIKGLDPARFTPYLRNFATGRLTETTYSKELVTGLSIILIEKNLDTTRGRSRITSYFATHREILPTRMVWPDNGMIVIPN